VRLTAVARVIAAALAVAAPGALAAQDALVARAGDRVRLRVDTTSSAFAWKVGTLAAVHPETLVLRPCFRCAGEPYARANVRALEISVGRPNHAGAGIALGALAAAASVGISYRQCERHDRGEGPPCGLVGTVLPIAVIGGAIVGGVVGRFVPAGRERWWPARVAASAR
jgi:hypothetical protein